MLIPSAFHPFRPPQLNAINNAYEGLKAYLRQKGFIYFSLSNWCQLSGYGSRRYKSVVHWAFRFKELHYLFYHSAFVLAPPFQHAPYYRAIVSLSALQGIYALPTNK